MPRKTILERHQSSAAVEHAVVTLGPQVAAKAAARLAAGLPGEPPRDLPGLLALLPRALERSRARLAEADAAYTGARTASTRELRRRDRATGALRQALLVARALLGRPAGAERPGAPAGRGRLASRDHQVLLRQADAHLRELRAWAASGAPPAEPCRVVDPPALLGQVEARQRELAAALTAVRAAGRRAHLARADRRRELDAHDATFRRAARLFAALLDAAGMAELAGPLRLPERRRHRGLPGDPAAAGPPPGSSAVNGSST